LPVERKELEGGGEKKWYFAGMMFRLREEVSAGGGGRGELTREVMVKKKGSEKRKGN